LDAQGAEPVVEAEEPPIVIVVGVGDRDPAGRLPRRAGQVGELAYRALVGPGPQLAVVFRRGRVGHRADLVEREDAGAEPADEVGKIPRLLGEADKRPCRRRGDAETLHGPCLR